jgi:hypothetical protein
MGLYRSPSVKRYVVIAKSFPGVGTDIPFVRYVDMLLRIADNPVVRAKVFVSA